MFSIYLSDPPCEVGLSDSVDHLVDAKDFVNFTQFSLDYIDKEEKPFGKSLSRFGGQQSLEEREKSFYARNQTLHCGFVKGPEGSPSTGFDLDANDKTYMNTCKVVVSSCIFGNSDFLRRPTSKRVNELLLQHTHIFMFIDMIIYSFGKKFFYTVSCNSWMLLLPFAILLRKELFLSF